MSLILFFHKILIVTMINSFYGVVTMEKVEDIEDTEEVHETGEITKSLIENSLAAALSSIEIYNKPDFKYREQIFTILNINSWELLLKAKILDNAEDKIDSLYVMSGGVPKKNRNGIPLTIDIIKAMRKLNIDSTIESNITSLIEIRDTAVHFINDSKLSYILYTLGAASLKNYQMLINEWFSRSLLEYNFYILPLAFAYNFKTFSLVDLEESPEAISNLIKAISDTQSSIDTESRYHFVCEIQTKLQSVNSFMGETGFTTVIDSAAEPDTPIILKTQHIIDKYPISYTELYESVKKAKPHIKQHQINSLIREHDIKNKPEYSYYNFTNRSRRDNYEKNGILPRQIQSIYNEDAVRFIIENID